MGRQEGEFYGTSDHIASTTPSQQNDVWFILHQVSMPTQGPLKRPEWPMNHQTRSFATLGELTSVNSSSGGARADGVRLYKRAVEETSVWWPLL